MKKLLSTAAVLGALYMAFVWLTETELFSTDIRFKIHSEYSATLGGFDGCILERSSVPGPGSRLCGVPHTGNLAQRR